MRPHMKSEALNPRRRNDFSATHDVAGLKRMDQAKASHGIKVLFRANRSEVYGFRA